MSDNLKESLQKLKDIDGFVAAAIAHGESGMALGTIGGGSAFNIDVAVAANSEVIRAKNKAMKALNLDESIEDILITLDSQYHLIRPMADNPIVFIYLALSRSNANLAMARFKLDQIEKNLTI
jgi:hypothetical protein